MEVSRDLLAQIREAQALQSTLPCSGCSEIDFAAWFDFDRNTATSITLKPPQRYFWNQGHCEVCKFIASAFLLQASKVSSIEQLDDHNIILQRHHHYDPWYKILGISGAAPSCDYLTMSLGTEDKSRVCIHREEDSGTKPRLRETMGSDSYLDISLIDHWLHCCQRRHGTEICPRSKLSKVDEFGCDDIFLIDVKKRCVVRASSRLKYYALSYVWGSTREQAIEDWYWPPDYRQSCPETFRIDLPRTLPRTIEDALQLTNALRMKYIWIDFYCIDQKDPEHVRSQINRMSSIYKCAELTLVAIDSVDVNAGIAGLSGRLPRRKQPVLQTPAGKLVATYLQAPVTEVGLSEWDRRAWTMQEYVLSDRCLILGDDATMWKCNTHHLHDCLPQSPDPYCFWRKLENAGDSCDSVVVDNEQEPLLTMYSKFLSVYSARRVRYPEDMLAACQGILQQLSKTTGAEFIYGLPCQDMLAALAWVPHSSGYLRRRPEFPSWTWLGWKGRVEIRTWIECHEYFERTPRSSPAVESVGELELEVDQPNAKRSRSDGCSEMFLDTLLAHGPAKWTSRENELEVLSYLTQFKAVMLRINGAWMPDSRTSKHSQIIGDHWTLLDVRGQTIKDVLGVHGDYESTEYLFRLDADTSKLIQQQGCKVSVLFLTHYEEGPVSITNSPTVKDVITALVLVELSDGCHQRIASITMPVRDFLEAQPEEMLVTIV